jgi:hypothetical protein
MEPDLKGLGQRLAAAQDISLDSLVDRERSRSRLLGARRPRRWRAVPALALAAVVLLLAGFALVRAERSQPLAFRVGPDARSEQVGSWIAAGDAQSVPIHFSDGTELTLLQQGRARILDVSASGAAVFVERGKLRAAVVPRPGGQWRLFMGPYQVRVTGTTFDVGWEPEAERFALSLLEGSVVVSGPAIEGERVVRAGESLELGRALQEAASEPVLRLPERDQEAEPAVATEPSAELEPSAAPARERRSAERVPERPRPALEPVAPRGLDFRELARAGRYREALAASEREGFEQLCQRSNAAELMLLADVARLAGNPVLARRAYERARERFPGSDGGQAAFFLGRLAFDERADYADAARYFQLSLSEQPDGPLAREAAGRLLEAQLLSGDGAAARAAARRYLERHGDGPHARVARRVLATP